jgi:hypothetical protein
MDILFILEELLNGKGINHEICNVIASLLNMLVDGETVEKEHVLKIFRMLLDNSDYASCFQNEIAIVALINIINSESESMKEVSVKILCLVICTDDSQSIFVKSGGIVSLVSLLGNGSKTSKKRAARLLCVLAAHSKYRSLIKSLGISRRDISYIGYW